MLSSATCLHPFYLHHLYKVELVEKNDNAGSGVATSRCNIIRQVEAEVSEEFGFSYV